MRAGRIFAAVFATLLGTLALATGVASVENKSTTAKPVPSPRAHHADVPEAPEPPDTPDVPDAPGILHHSGNERVGIGQDITVAAGETHDGDVVCVGGHVVIDGHVNGDVTVVAGRVDIKGSVDGDVTGVASRLTLDSAARIDGGLTNVGGSLRRNDASVNGQVVNIPFGIALPSWGHGFPIGFNPLAGLLVWSKLLSLFVFFVCALLLIALVPDRIRLISEEAPIRLFTAFIFGLIGYVVFFFVEFFLAITLIGLPLVFLLYLVFKVLKWMAMCGIFHQIGHRLGRSLGRDMSLLGATLFGFLPFALLRLVPFCIGFSIWFLVEILAFGYLILTRVGTRGSPAAFAPAATAPSSPSPQPPAPPATIDPVTP